MKKKFDSVELQRAIRAKLSEKYTRSREAEMEELRMKFGHLKKQKTGGRTA